MRRCREPLTVASATTPWAQLQIRSIFTFWVSMIDNNFETGTVPHYCTVLRNVYIWIKIIFAERTNKVQVANTYSERRTEVEIFQYNGKCNKEILSFKYTLWADPDTFRTFRWPLRRGFYHRGNFNRNNANKLANLHCLTAAPERHRPQPAYLFVVAISLPVALATSYHAHDINHISRTFPIKSFLSVLKACRKEWRKNTN